jgi:hypothetical protein
MTSVLSAVPYHTSAVGLQVKPTYEQLMEYIEKDPDKIKYPNRRATILRNTHWLSQLDGEGWNQLKTQIQLEWKNEEHEMLLRQMAATMNLNLRMLRAFV